MRFVGFLYTIMRLSRLSMNVKTEKVSGVAHHFHN
jgi:hypothetical protein